MLEAIVFDFDGVIVDSEPLHHRAFAEVFATLGLDVDYDRYIREYIGFDDRDAIRHACRTVGKPLVDRTMRRLLAEKAAAFDRIVARGVAPIDGAIELVRAAAGRWPIAIASGALRSDIDLILPALNDDDLAACFAAIVTADDVARSKPDPATYLKAAERLGAAPAVCLAIEDTPTGLASAKAAGMRTLGIATSYEAAKLDADRVVHRPADVNVAQLESWFA